MTAKNYTLALGCLADPFSAQLTAQGLPFNPETMRHLELDAQAASRLKVRGVVAYAAGEKLYDKIAKQVWAEVDRAIKARAHDQSALREQSDAARQLRDEQVPISKSEGHQ